ncbi:MAG: methyltransferase domain-containing protein [Dehalococcoidia bacterium]
MDDDTFIRQAYLFILRRPADDFGFDYFRNALAGGMAREQVLDTLLYSDALIDEVVSTNLAQSLHFSRKAFIQSLPRARRILDLGGAAIEKPEGALVAMGYPYEFEQLTIVDLPNEARHLLYQSREAPDIVQSTRGPVRYRYHSMVDFSDFSDEAFDLVYSGQTIEHVTEDEADLVFAGVAQALRPGGTFALDTPNARATRLQQAEFIDPDHKVEYLAAEIVAKAHAAGFRVERTYGLNHLGPCWVQKRFDAAETARRRGLFDDAENCYLLAFLFRKPEAGLR